MAAAQYIRGVFEQAGYSVREQAFTSSGRTVKNLEAELPGGSRKDEIVVVGAHYDSVTGTPGANDNASGVAALLALARSMRAHQPARTLRFVAFVNEEPPYFLSWEMGSRQYARAAKGRGERIRAMLSLETIGYYSDEPGSQAFPLPFRMGYPEAGNFIAFVGNMGSRGLVREAVGSFRAHARFPSEGIAAPAAIPGIGWSDHWSFWQEGYAAVMVTDTAVYRYPRYHTGLDVPEALDYERMARVVAGLTHVVADLAGR
jgi:Zn-dependent M28 family amino/carboxypeptidase